MIHITYFTVPNLQYFTVHYKGTQDYNNPSSSNFIAHCKMTYKLIYYIIIREVHLSCDITSSLVGSVLTSNSTSNSYFSRSWMYQHLPNHRVPSLFDSSRNQSLSASLLFWTYWRKDANILFSQLDHELEHVRVGLKCCHRMDETDIRIHWAIAWNPHTQNNIDTLEKYTEVPPDS